MKKQKQNKKRKTKNQEKGITLIALVITIVILIILAVISINIVFGENGIISRAESAKDHQANAEAHDQEKMDSLSGIIDSKVPNIDPETGWNLNKVNKITSEDGEIVPVPKGYVTSTIAGEKSVNTGFVIKEGTDGNLTKGINEFVWVPVRNISDIYDEANKAGQLWDFGSYNLSTSSFEGKNPAIKKAYPTIQNSEYREPDVVTFAINGNDSSSGSECDAISSKLQEAGLSSTATAADLKKQLQNEFNNMIESVKKYGGFYIGRYETGDLSQTKAVVQKGNTDIGNQIWYTMYRLSKTIGVNNNVTTSMIWGCQYDATLRWMQNEGITDIVKNYPTNSASYGNYIDNSINYIDTDGTTKTTTSGTGTKIPTGSAEITKINNIYDMAGNVNEWTMEAHDNEFRVNRGGNYNYAGSIHTASDRTRYEPPNGNALYGSRSTLYITP